MSKNAKKEFINTVGRCKVIAVNISYNHNYGDPASPPYGISILKTEYTEEEYENFLDSLDFEYDSGYGGQNLFGTIWCENGMWITRGEYDGSEWWEVNKMPKIEEGLRNRDREREREINKVLK